MQFKIFPFALLALASALLPLRATGHADDQVDARCDFGRLADGKGKLVRCISKNEAAWLSLKTPDVPAAAKQGDADAGAAPRGADGGASETDGGPKPAPEPEEPKVEIQLEVGPLTVDEGTLPKALAKLSVPKDRYEKCIQDHGGLTRDTGELTIRFLVRQRGRAEGVHVVKRRGVGEVAGKCVADVIDRRLVGVPSVEMVGATLVLRLKKGG